MSSKEQKTPEGQAPEEIIMDQHEEIEAVEPEASAEQVDPRDEKIANLEAQLAEAQTRERDGILRVKAEMENLRRRTELDIEKAHKFALEKFINELLPVIDSLDRTTIQRITLLHNAQYVTWRNVIRFHHCDSLMHIRVQRHVSFGDGNCSESKSVISVFVIIHGPACECRAVFVTPPHSRAAVSQEKLLPA